MNTECARNVTLLSSVADLHVNTSTEKTIVPPKPVANLCANPLISTKPDLSSSNVLDLYVGPSTSREYGSILKVIKSENYDQCSVESKDQLDVDNRDQIVLGVLKQQANTYDNMSDYLSDNDDYIDEVIAEDDDYYDNDDKDAENDETENDDSNIRINEHEKSGSTISMIEQQRAANALLLKYKSRSHKSGKGLRHLSAKVCQIVHRKKVTTYKEVADELIEKLMDPTNEFFVGKQYDVKNIRRRVYDALNVLIALNIISKQQKLITWNGLPKNDAYTNLSEEKEKCKLIVSHKFKQLYDLILYQVALERLVQRNMEMEKVHGPVEKSCRLNIPFVLVSCNKDTFIECDISEDNTEYRMRYHGNFDVRDDMNFLKQMDLALGLDKGQSSKCDLENAKLLVPKQLHKLVEKLGKGDLELSLNDVKDLMEAYGETCPFFSILEHNK